MQMYKSLVLCSSFPNLQFLAFQIRLLNLQTKKLVLLAMKEMEAGK